MMRRGPIKSCWQLWVCQSHTAEANQHFVGPFVDFFFIICFFFLFCFKEEAHCKQRQVHSCTFKDVFNLPHKSQCPNSGGGRPIQMSLCTPRSPITQSNRRTRETCYARARVTKGPVHRTACRKCGNHSQDPPDML